MRYFNAKILGFDDDNQQGATWRDSANYDRDELPTPASTQTASEEADYRNAEQYAELLNDIILTEEPIIITFRNIGQMLQDGINVEAGRHFGHLAQEIYEITRVRIERAARIDEVK